MKTGSGVAGRGGRPDVSHRDRATSCAGARATLASENRRPNVSPFPDATSHGIGPEPPRPDQGAADKVKTGSGLAGGAAGFQLAPLHPTLSS